MILPGSELCGKIILELWVINGSFRRVLDLKGIVKPYVGSEPYLFISYCSKDKSAVEVHLRVFSQRGYRFWYDKGLIAGSKWPEEIPEREKSASCALMFLSKNSIDSFFCKTELQYAIQSHIPTIFIFLDDFKHPSWLEFYLSTIQAIRLTENTILVNELEKNADFRKCRSTANNLHDFTNSLHSIRKEFETKKTSSSNNRRLILVSLVVGILVIGGISWFLYNRFASPPKTEPPKIIQVAAGENFSAYLSAEGRVATAGDNSLGQDECRKWENIKKIAAKGTRVVGLTTDGEIVSTLNSEEKKCSSWSDVEDIALTKEDLFAVTSDNRVLSTSKKYKAVTEDTKVKLIVGNQLNTILLLGEDGKLILCKENSKPLSIESDQTKTIQQIACGVDHCVWLYDDGTVGTYCDSSNENKVGCYVDKWKDITSIAAGNRSTVGLKRDGTLIGTGKRDSGQFEFSTWSNIQSIDTDYDYTVASDSNGKVYAIGKNESSRCETGFVRLDVMSLSNLEKSAENEDVLAWRYLGEKYYYGRDNGTEGKKEEVVSLFEKGTEKGDSISEYMLGWVYYTKESEEDLQKAFDHFRNSANAGLPDAEAMLGTIYEEGKCGIDKNLKTAQEWYRRAADQGNAEGSYRLGLLLLKRNEEAIVYNLNQAINYLRYAAERGHEKAQFEMGRYYYDDENYKRDCYNARIWFSLAHENGVKDSAKYLGYIYENGYDIDPDINVALKYYRESADMGEEYGAYAIGHIAYKGAEGIPKDYNAAVSWYKLSLEREQANMQYIAYDMGCMYFDGGYGIEQDYKEALSWFKSASEYDDPRAWYKLGYMYFNGLGGIEKDTAKAEEWIRKAAERDNQEAIDFLSENFEKKKKAA